MFTGCATAAFVEEEWTDRMCGASTRSLVRPRRHRSDAVLLGIAFILETEKVMDDSSGLLGASTPDVLHEASCAGRK